MPALARRTFLALLGASGGAAALAACTPSNAPNPPTNPGSGAAGSGTGGPGGDGGPRVTRTVAERLSTPWSIAFLPDGSAFVSERDSGRILRLGAGGDPREAAPIAVRTDTSEGGLLGLEAAPDFASSGTLYAYYTAERSNRVVSLHWDGSSLGGERVLVDGIPEAPIHNGGRIKAGRDGFLYIGTGDATNRSSSQDRASLDGKVLRVASDGAPADGNPFGNRVFTYGHRNVQGLAWDSSGRLWASELGPDRDDELNLLQAGSQYGWPSVTGARSSNGSVPAVHVWPSTADASPSALAIVDDVAYVACLRGERLWRLPLPAAGSTGDGSGQLPGATEHFRGQYGRLRDVVQVPGQRELWIATNEGSNSRILAVAI
ncbi:sorbosone dehydrogenase family protein [Sinomonas sp. R1AF57]|uniref:PQQ-dependent sugar dehydrogenase n=1 Tax=Sinomonas sp. R1AF57 TaxID=2020377 RepID=UPI000B614A0D|nr:PQQ-dependent sugar dehydrogenase [Sinomonas sp. R1AF57]ASN52844.1 glucose sorbosone dehydrogenase [Sinomonas sp. R1AF57]